MLRKVKLPREFAVHRTVLSSSVHGQSPEAEDNTPKPTTPLGLDSAADWLVVFDTELSSSMAIKVRTTSQIPVSEYAKSLGGKTMLPPGIENFMVPEEFPTKVRKATCGDLACLMDDGTALTSAPHVMKTVGNSAT